MASKHFVWSYKCFLSLCRCSARAKKTLTKMLYYKTDGECSFNVIFWCVLISAGKKGTTEHAAVWVPDSEASTCMHCLKSKFTALNRRVGVTYFGTDFQVSSLFSSNLWVDLGEGPGAG